ncbi:MAG: hypothetical protein IIC52_05600 [Proteobacteria bacterium]|nr:hypothetical protein [Pseudomonadota bacterium]
MVLALARIPIGPVAVIECRDRHGEDDQQDRADIRPVIHGDQGGAGELHHQGGQE